MNIEIKSVKIKDSKPFISYFQLDENGNHEAEQDYKKGPKCHEDFINKLNALAIHYALLTYYLNLGPIKKVENYDDKSQILDSFKVGGFHIGGKDEDQGIVIVGHRILPNGKAQILNSPFYRFNEDDATRYKFMDELQLALEDCKDEAKLYISGEKVYKEPVVPTLFDNIPAEDSQETV